jgi:hypothetical protein
MSDRVVLLLARCPPCPHVEGGAEVHHLQDSGLARKGRVLEALHIKDLLHRHQGRRPGCHSYILL